MVAHKLIRPVGPSNPVWEEYNQFHKFLVFKCKPNSLVRACDEGVLLQCKAEDNSPEGMSLGNRIILLNHKKGIKAIYGYLCPLFMETGKFVLKGQALAGPGKRKGMDELCLYFQVKDLNTDEPYKPDFFETI